MSRLAKRPRAALALKIQGMGPWAVVLLFAGVSIANPKNLVVLLGAGFIA